MPNPNEQFEERPEKTPEQGPVIVSRDLWDKMREESSEASFDALAVGQALGYLKIALTLNTSLPEETKKQYVTLVNGLAASHKNMCGRMVHMIDAMIEAEGLDIS